jgi:RNA recognition motif-containing protein
MNREDVAKQKDDEIKRKIFLGGLNKDTKESTIEAYFSKWGEIEDILINRNIGDNSSKRCAFLLFKSHIVAQELIQSRVVHIIEGNKVEVK